MKKLIFLCSLILVSCSLFENEQDFEIYPPNIIGEWYQTDFEGNIKFHKEVEFDSTINPVIQRRTFSDDYTCEVTNATPPYSTSFSCEWRIYGNKPEVYLKLDYEHIYDPWPFYMGELFRIKELSDQKFILQKIGDLRKNQ